MMKLKEDDNIEQKLQNLDINNNNLNILKLNYIGSKRNLLPTYGEIFNKYIKKNCIFADFFCGTGIVSNYVKTNFNATIIANDMQLFSYYITKSRIVNYTDDEVDIIKYHFDKMNNLTNAGFFTKNYSDKYFTFNNCKKIDGCRLYIESLTTEDKIKEYLISSLISAADKVSNTASVYGAFLKHIKKSASNDLFLEHLPIVNNNQNGTDQFYNSNILDLRYENEIDVLYLDPPYNSRQYGSNYHILETIAKYDNPILSGITLLPPYKKSTFCSKAKNTAFNSLKEIINKFKYKILIMSYSSDGIINLDDILTLFKQKGKTTLYEINYKKFQSQKSSEKKNIIEYLIVCEIGVVE